MKVYTDGACSGNPGPEGYGILAIYNNEIIYATQHKELFTTNNRMELMAVLKALQFSVNNENCYIEICTDSAYVCNGINNWCNNWSKNNWVTIKGEPVKNQDLWKKILVLYNQLDKVKIIKVKGHSDDKWNNLVDKLATGRVDVQSLTKTISCDIIN